MAKVHPELALMVVPSLSWAKTGRSQYPATVS
jgi:hypothetical protein